MWAVAAGCALLIGGALMWSGLIPGWLPGADGPLAAAEQPPHPVGPDGKAVSKTAVSADGTQVVLQEGNLQNVKVAPVELEPFQEVREAIGQVAYNEDRATPVFSNYTGRVVSLVAKAGDDVARGSVLFNLDSTDLVNNESAYISAAAALTAARSHTELTRHALERARVLYDAKAIALRDYEQAQDDHQAAMSAEVSAVGALGAARNVLRLYGKSDEFIDTLPVTRRVDSILPIKSPIQGTVVLRKVGPGQFILPDNQNPIYVVADLSTMWLRVNVAEADAPVVRVGQEVQVQVMALPGRIFKARIVHVSAAVDPVTRRVAVRAEVPNPDRLLKPEMFATARILAGKPEQSVGIPLNGVIRAGPVATVWVETSPAHFASRSVQLGLEQGGFVQVLGGLQPGERVVSDGAIFLDNAAAAAK